MIIVCNDFFFCLINYVFVLISLLPSVLLGRTRGERIEEKMQKKKTKKMEDDAAATSDEAGRTEPDELRCALLDTCFNFPCEVRL